MSGLTREEYMRTTGGAGFPPRAASSSTSATSASVWNTITNAFTGAGDAAAGATGTAVPSGMTWHDFMSKEDLADVLETVYQKGYANIPVDYADPVLNQRKVFLTTDLDEMQANALIAKLTYLDAKAPGTPIDLFIYSNGGYGGYLVGDYLHRLSSPVNTWCLDNCCSAGAILLASGTGKRRASPSACISVHIVMRETDPSDKTENPGHKAKDQDLNQLRRFWSAHSSLPPEIYGVDHEQFFYFTADEALKYGIIDEIVDQPSGKVGR
jgi:ATP-dependent Clp protease protease subunit